MQLTRDGGKTWTNVTPKGLPPGQVNSIEVSPHESGKAYFVFYRVKWNDNAPYIYRTNDYGKTWTPIVSGLPADEAVRVVREGRLRKGMLYGGTETGAVISFDDGAHWQSFQSNLPHVPVTETWDGGVPSCNAFAYRFEGVNVAATGGAWQPLVGGHWLQDPGYRVLAKSSGFVARRA